LCGRKNSEATFASMKPGDIVRVIDEAIEGTVTRLERNMVFVDTGDFEFSYRTEQLVLIEAPAYELKAYKQHSPSVNSHKHKTVTKPKTMTDEERIEELGRVRGKRNSRGILEFDLHIHDLLVKHDHMTPGEMLNYQLDYAVHCLEETLKKREPSLVFIHGVGKGVLKVELHKIIRAYNFSFHDGFMQEYGVGATRVELR
jgi:hypothetical protein